MKKRYVVILTGILMLWLMVPGFLAAGQTGNQTIDQTILGLKKKIEGVKGKEKVDGLNQLAFTYISQSPNQCVLYAEKALKLSRSLDYLKGECEALRNLGIGSAILGKSKDALTFFGQALEIAKKLGDKKLVSKMLLNTGNVYSRLSQPAEALKYQLQALEVEKESGSDAGVATILSNLGVTYQMLNRNTRALDTHLRSLEIYDRLEIKNEREVSNVLLNIGILYSEIQRPKDALTYLHRSIAIKEKIGDKAGTARVHGAIAASYQRLRDFKRALVYYKKALDVAEEIGLNMVIPRITGSMGTIYEQLNDHPRAMACYEKSIAIGEKTGEKLVIGLATISMGKLQIKMKDYPSALKNLQMGLEIAARMKKKDLEIRAYKHLSWLYEEKKDYKKALEYHKRLLITGNELLNEKNQRQLNDLQAKYENAKKEKEIEGLKKNNEIKDLKISSAEFARNAFIVGFILVFIILALLYKKYLYLFAFWKKKKIIGQYGLMDKIASGGMGTVFKAHSITDKSHITAVKILKEELFTHEICKQRFKREAVIIDKLEHPNIVKILERGESRQQLFIAMEFLEGETLEQRIEHGGFLPVGFALHIMIQVAEAIAFIHSKKIIHRDLKPANIMLVENKAGAVENGDDEKNPVLVKLLDFGLARMEFDTRLTHTGNFLGTTEYVSPEQILNAEASPASDIFAMGVTFYRMLWSQSPFPGETIIDIMSRIIRQEPLDVDGIRTDVPGELTQMVKDMLNKQPEQRPTAESIVAAVQEIGRGLQVKWFR